MNIIKKTEIIKKELLVWVNDSEAPISSNVF